MQLLAIDLGDKRTGMAVGDSETGIVTPVDTIESPGGDHLLEAIGRYAREYGADRLVIGLPRHDGGRESDRSRAARAFAARLHETLNLPVHFQDERYSSAAADDQMSRSGLTHR
ncbi:MAG: Holliday junction resolvase RuvX, partial [Phycisphaeraceae bacterium]|nr:Holliday junction resolvase RuvX [Phycisphaeraceae bacterium]